MAIETRVESEDLNILNLYIRLANKGIDTDTYSKNLKTLTKQNDKKIPQA